MNWDDDAVRKWSFYQQQKPLLVPIHGSTESIGNKAKKESLVLPFRKSISMISIRASSKLFLWSLIQLTQSHGCRTPLHVTKRVLSSSLQFWRNFYIHIIDAFHVWWRCCFGFCCRRSEKVNQEYISNSNFTKSNYF